MSDKFPTMATVIVRVVLNLRRRMCRTVTSN